MKVLHVSPSFSPAHVYGGTTESLFQICRHIAQSGAEIRVLTTNANGSDQILQVETRREVEITGGLRVRYCPRLMAHSVSPTLVRLLPSYVSWSNVVHLTAVYSFPTIPTLLACRVLGKPAIWSPRGALQRWKGSTRLACKAGWEGVCRLVAPRRLVLHVTSEEEARESLSRFSGTDSVVISNGVELPERLPHLDCNGLLRLLYLGRIHPKKGIENLLAACKILQTQAWSLTIAGSGERHYTARIQALIRELALSEKVRIVGEVLGKAKERLFTTADLIVVPSHTENFGMVVAEALAHGVPVIASRNTPWSRLEEMKCGLWVNNDPESLARAIEQTRAMALRDMGCRGREWMAREFCWSARAQEMIRAYERILDTSKSAVCCAHAH